MTEADVRLFYAKMRQALVKAESTWTDKANIFRTLLEEFFKYQTRNYFKAGDLYQRIEAYYDANPDEEEMRGIAHNIRKRTNTTVHKRLQFVKGKFIENNLSEGDIKSVYEDMVWILANSTQVTPDNLTLELIGSGSDDYLASLNVQQKNAVLSDSRIVFVNAGPGTGKTTLLVQRMIHAVKTMQEGVRIVALSYTNTAARQLKEKFNKQAFRYLNDNEYVLSNSTIHSYCLKALKTYTSLDGSPFNYMIAGDEDIWESAQDVFSEMRGQFTLVQITEILKTPQNTWPDDVITAVDVVKKRNNLISFNDILLMFYEKLTCDAAFAKWVLDNVDMFVIDEAQDLSVWNFKILDRMLELKPTLKVFMVGDPRQNIFEFNGGAYKYLADFLDAHACECETKDLSISYRCPKEVLNLVNSFIFKDCRNIPLNSDIRGGMELTPFQTCDEESMYVADMINEIEDYDTCAVLSSTIKGLNGIIDKLNERQIPFVVAGGRRRFKQHVRYVNNLLSIIHNNNIKSIRSVSKVLDIDICTQPLGAPRNFTEKELFIQSPFGKNLFSFGKEINRLELSLSDIVNRLLAEFLLPEWYSDELIQSDLLKLKNIVCGYKTMKEYLDAVSIDKERFTCFFDKDFKDSTADTSGPCVTLSTIHSAKGLEWRNLFLIGMNDQNFPGLKNYDVWNPSRHDNYLNKKRKELYVALTRTSDYINISYPRYVDGQEQTLSMLLEGYVRINNILN